MKILFITRNFPPQKGGLETAAYYLHSYFTKYADVMLLKWGGPRKFLFFVLPCFLVRAFLILSTKRIDIIYLNEGLLSFLGFFLEPFRVPIVVTINGLDITYKNKIYQSIIPKCISRVDRIVCISRAAKSACLEKGIPENKIRIIPDGIEDEFYIDKDRTELKEKLINKFKFNLSDKKILFSAGRLVERKGIHWFIDRVMPILIEDYREFIYIIAGDGPMRRHIEDIILKKNLKRWVMFLGKVDDELLRLLYNISDIFIMPNISVEGDMEGFGIVALEAASCKIPVVASNLEGIKDAIVDKENGYLIPPGDANAYFDKIKSILLKDDKKFKERVRTFTKENYNWGKVVYQYFSEFKKLTGQ